MDSKSDERFIRELSGKVGKDWKRIGTNLGCKSAEIQSFEYNSRNNLEEQAFQMLVTWWRRQPNNQDAREWLRAALISTDRSDLASDIPGLKFLQ